MDLGLKGARVLAATASEDMTGAIARCFSMENAVACISGGNLEMLQDMAARINAETGNAVFTMPCDFSDSARVERMVRNVAETLGGLDVLVASVNSPPEPFDAFDLAVNVTLNRTALPYLRRSKRAAILAVSSDIAPAMMRAIKTLSKQLAPDSIRVNGIVTGDASPEAVATVAVFLCAPAAGSVKGVALPLDGGIIQAAL
jgi:3-oxoacyl-[acyl-carrier protein] reductase